MKNSHYAILDQLVVSGSNFLSSVCLARLLGTNQYGLYIFGFTTLVVIQGLASSCLFSSTSVLCSAQKDGIWGHYIGIHALMLLALISLVSSGMLLSSFLLENGEFAENGKILVVLGGICLPFLGHEFGRVVLFTQLESRFVFIGDCIAYGGRGVALITAAMFGVSQAWQLIILLGVTSFAGVVWFCWVLQRSPMKITFTLEKTIIKDIFSYSRWSFAEWIPFMLSSQLYIYVVTFVIGNEATGVLAACRNLTMPVIVLLVGVMNYALPFFSRYIEEHSLTSVGGKLRQYAGVLFVSVAVYLLLICYFRHELLYLLFGKYEDYSALVLVYAASVMLNVVFNPAEIYFRATRRPKFLFYARLISALASASLCYPIIVKFGIYGAVYTHLIAQLVMGSGLYFFILWQRKLSKGRLADVPI